MALIKCPECNKEISDKAASCPGCGSPVSVKASVPLSREPNPNIMRAGAKWEGIGFLLIIVGMFTAFTTSADNHVGGLTALSGFVVFIIGRFM